jgi:hypothetical protein
MITTFVISLARFSTESLLALLISTTADPPLLAIERLDPWIQRELYGAKPKTHGLYLAEPLLKPGSANHRRPFP